MCNPGILARGISYPGGVWFLHLSLYYFEIINIDLFNLRNNCLRLNMAKIIIYKYLWQNENCMQFGKHEYNRVKA